MGSKFLLAWSTLLAWMLLAWIGFTDNTAAQTLTVLRSFGNLTNASSAQPESQLVQAPDGMLYGTTSSGYGGAAGTVFKIQPDGSGFVVLKRFNDPLEGSNPVAGLALAGNTLYGTTPSGGVSGAGTVFKLNTDGTGFAVLKHFAGDPFEGGGSFAALTVSGNDLYGTTPWGGGSRLVHGWGTVFKLKTDGTGYTVLKSFLEEGAQPSLVPRGRLTLSGDVLYGTTMGGFLPPPIPIGSVFKINTDGTGFDTLRTGLESPWAGLTLGDGVLYGTSYKGGRSNLGTVFKLTTDGTGYRVLKEFTGDDGAHPRADLVLSNGVLYGTTPEGGRRGGGIVFRLNTDGTEFTVLREVYNGNIEDGSNPNGGLLLANGILYGSTYGGGEFGNGTLFQLNTNGSSYAVIKDFNVIAGDAAFPVGGLTLSENHLYGTTFYGGDYGFGAVFRSNIDGTGYTVLKHFAGAPHDGARPASDLVLSDGWLYGTTYSGGASNVGTVFTLKTDGTSYRILRDSNRGEGGPVLAREALSNGVLYGVTYSGGTSNAGTVFRLNVDGSGHRVLREFSVDDGARPNGGLALSKGVLYGTTYHGGRSNRGTVFRMNSDGTGFGVLKEFPTAENEAAIPAAGVVVIDGVLYGTTEGFGGPGLATLFRMNTDGTGFRVLRSFGVPWGDGRYPGALLAASSNVLYGVTKYGGSLQKGTIFKIHTDGTGYTILLEFQGTDGESPMGGLALSEGSIYGVTYSGGALGFGTLFHFDLAPRISLERRAMDNAFVLSWSDPDLSLQWSPTVTAPYTTLQGATSPYTNSNSGAQGYFRLTGSR